MGRESIIVIETNPDLIDYGEGIYSDLELTEDLREVTNEGVRYPEFESKKDYWMKVLTRVFGEGAVLVFGDEDDDAGDAEIKYAIISPEMLNATRAKIMTDICEELSAVKKLLAYEDGDLTKSAFIMRRQVFQIFTKLFEPVIKWDGEMMLSMTDLMSAISDPDCKPFTEPVYVTQLMEYKY